MIQLFKDKKYWREMCIILLFGIVINIACFCMPLVVHASGEETQYFPFQSGDNPSNLTVNQDFVNSLFENGAVFVHAYVDNRDNTRTIYSCVTDIELSNSNPIYLYAELSTLNLYQFSLQFDGNPLSYKAKFYRDYNDGTTPTLMSTDSNTLAQFGALYSPYYSTYKHVYWCKYTINRNGANNSSEPVVYLPSEEINVGDFTDLPPLDEILNNLTDTYTPDFSPVYPNIDNNKTDLENEKSFFDTLSQGITQNFNNLGANLQKFFNKIQEKLTNVGNAISTNIHNGFATLMQNISDFFGPKFDKIIELLTRLVNDDEEDVKEVWESTQIYQDFDSISQFTSTGFAVWQDTNEPNTYKIPFHVEQIPLLHCDRVQYIDLGLFSSVIPYIRSIMWALMVYSIFYTVVDSIANYINGGDE